MPHCSVFSITALTMTIGGIRVAVILDRNDSDGILEEMALTYFAPANDGTVWSHG